MIQVVEMGPRDGLQNEKGVIPTEAKVAFVDALSLCGYKEIEVSAFVSPQWVPQLADAAQVFKSIRRTAGILYSALVPNDQGLDRALEAGVDKVCVFTAASDSFNRKNVNTTIDGTFKRMIPVIDRARSHALPVRGYISTAFWCPYEGPISAHKVLEVALRLKDAGVDEISIGDTIGKATSFEVETLLDLMLHQIDKRTIAMHFHDTYGRAVGNVLQACRLGIEIFDASIGGLGGCPYAPGAPGNVSTEAVVLALKENDLPTSLDLEKLNEAKQTMVTYLPRMGQN